MYLLWMIALRHLWLARKRTLVLGSAMSLVCFLFLCLQALTLGFIDKMQLSSITLMSGHVNVGGFYKIRSSSADPIIYEKEKLHQVLKEAVPESMALVERVRGWGKIISLKSSLSTSLAGIDIEKEPFLVESLQLAPEKSYHKEGSLKKLGNLQDLKNPNTMALFAEHARKLQVGIGDTVTLLSEATGGQENSIDLKIVAILEDMGMMSGFTVFVPQKVLIDLYQVSSDVTGAFMFYLKDISQSNEVMKKLRVDLEKKGYLLMDHNPQAYFMKFESVQAEDWRGQKLDLTTWEDEISMLKPMISIFQTLGTTFTLILMILIMGGMLNAFWMSVRERTQEIGTMRAIGASRFQILFLFVLESFSLCLIACFVGGFLAYGGVLILNVVQVPLPEGPLQMLLMSQILPLKLPFLTILGGCLSLAFLASLGAFWPAWKGAKLKPVDALLTGK